MDMEHVCGKADQILRAKLFDYIQMTNLLDFGKFTSGIIAGNHVTKIISCQVNASSRQEIKQLGKLATGHVHSSQGKSPPPPPQSALNRELM